MYKNVVVFVLISLLVYACKQEIKIEFVKAVQTDMGNIKKESANFKTVLAFLNLAEEEFEVKDVILDFKIDGKEMGTILEEKARKVKAHSEFNIPVKYEYETKRILDPNAEPEHLYLIELSGKLTLRDKNGKEIVVPVRHKESYEYKTNKEERIENREERKKRREERKALK
jgi:hypothetical protein